MLSEENSGKISPTIMEDIIYPNLGARRKEILVGPAAGLDTCVIDLGRDQVLVASTDPLSLIPALGAEDSAWMSVNLLANDLSTSGFPPQFMLVDLNLPPSLSEHVLKRYWEALSAECLNLGISIVGGNTGKFEGCDLTIIGSGTTLAVGEREKVIVSSGAKLGDRVLVTKGAAISTTGLLARIFPNTVRRELGRQTQETAAEYFRKISALNDSMLAKSFNPDENVVSAIHDVAEGGVFASLLELAKASSMGMKIFKSAVPISEETSSLCRLFEIDPYWSLGEGALVMTCSSKYASSLVSKLERSGVKSAIIGEILERSEGVFVSQENQNIPIIRPPSDPYWNAYYSATAKNWD